MTRHDMQAAIETARKTLEEMIWSPEPNAVCAHEVAAHAARAARQAWEAAQQIEHDKLRAEWPRQGDYE